MHLDKSSPEAKKFLATKLGVLEHVKKENQGNEAITNETVGQAHLENVRFYIVKLQVIGHLQHVITLHNRAEQDDQTGNYSKNTIKMYYTAGSLSDALKVFDDVDPQFFAMGKYDKYKSTAIHAALKAGETPTRGAPGVFDDMQMPGGTINIDVPIAPGAASVSPPAETSAAAPASSTSATVSSSEHIDYDQAMKLSKYAISAMQYEDRPTAIKNLENALRILRTGE